MGLVSISGKWRGFEEGERKDSCLVNPLMFRIYPKSSFNTCVCLGSTLSPPLCDPIRRAGFSCTNKHSNGSFHTHTAKGRGKGWATLRPNLFQMAPIDRIIYLGCVRVSQTTALYSTIVSSMTRIFSVFSYPGSWLAENPNKDGSPSWKKTPLMHRCGVTPTHLSGEDETTRLPPPPIWVSLWYSILQLGRVLCSDQRASFPLA